MTEPVLLVRSAVALVGAGYMALTRPSATLSRKRARALLLLLFILAWVVFILWRGWLLPPVSHDALAYHLPKAVLFARAHGYEPLSYLDARIRNIPENYEMLLAENIVLQHRDTITEWTSALFYVLFVIASAAIAERWWKARATIVALFAAGVPVALLHSGAHKNDLMTAFFIVAGLVASGRYISERDGKALLVAVAAFAAAVGTKPQAAAVALCVAPFLVWGPASDGPVPAKAGLHMKNLAFAAIFAVVAFLLLGGVVYVSNFVQGRGVIGVDKQIQRETVIAYGDWPNLWQGPYVLIAGPFAPDARELSVPWADRPWFWRRYELFFSHLGIPFALCAMAIPFAVFALRKKVPTETFFITAATLAAFFIMLPVNFQPHGMFSISLPRYALFIVPIVLSWTVVALPARAAAVAAVIALAAYAIDTARNDAFAPWAFVEFVRAHPNTRQVPFDAFRAAEVADRKAGPRDRIAIDAAFGTWIHPAFGAELSRPVDFIPQGDGPPPIRNDADWVVIDRGWKILWEHPQFRDLSQARNFLVRGKPAAEDTRVLRYLRGDSRFRLVFYNPVWNQAVFQRIR
ncbi:MAG: hypothetical protein ACXW2X_06730, partial [Thermoanaerobaculia bacterium]